MSERIGDARLAELVLSLPSIPYGFLDELVDNLKAERQYAEELERLPLTEGQSARMIERLRAAEAKLAEAGELLPCPCCSAADKYDNQQETIKRLEAENERLRNHWMNILDIRQQSDRLMSAALGKQEQTK